LLVGGDVEHPSMEDFRACFFTTKVGRRVAGRIAPFAVTAAKTSLTHFVQPVALLPGVPVRPSNISEKLLLDKSNKVC